jgi:thiamine-phosphate pyrophosphorylase
LHPRLFLITPSSLRIEDFLPQLESALAAGDVACLLVTANGMEDAELQKVAAQIAPLAQAAGAALLIQNDTRVAGRIRADGVHCDTDFEDLKLAIETFKPEQIVGAGAIRTRHEAMQLAEAGIDYVFFGLLDLPEAPEAHRKTIDFAIWWSDLFEIPCVALGGSDLASLGETARAGADFIALRSAIWEHPEGPGAAVRAANEILSGFILPNAEE